MSGRRQGFTLLELLMVVAVMAFAAAIGIPLLHSSLGHAELDLAADELAGALAYARLASARTDRACRVILDAAADTFAVQELGVDRAAFESGRPTLAPAEVAPGGYRNLGHPVKHGFTYRVDFAQEPRFRDIDVLTADFGGRPWVSFDAYGRPSSAGSVTIVRGGTKAGVSLSAEGVVTVVN